MKPFLAVWIMKGRNVPMATYILYNPYAQNGKGEEGARALGAKLADEGISYCDMTALESYERFFGSLSAEDKVILCGGDGTLNRFATEAGETVLARELYYYPTGTGNDFWHDVNKDGGDEPLLVTPYLKNLPRVTVKGVESAFLNGVGYGIDGYCCEVGDELRKTTDKAINYAGIAIKGLLFHFKPRNAKVTVDGVTHEFKKVWIAPVMHGRFYGGGMMMAPDQARNNEDGTCSLVMFHGSGKLKTLMIFPSLFKGEHVKHKKHITVLTGKEFEVEFDRPTPLQIDGETVLGVEKYTVSAGVPAKKRETVSVD